MAFAAAGWAKQQQIGTGPEPDIAGSERHHLSFGDHWYTVEIERSECLASGQAGFRHVALDPTPATVRSLVFGERCQKARGRPTLLVRLRSELRPYRLHAR